MNKILINRIGFKEFQEIKKLAKKCKDYSLLVNGDENSWNTQEFLTSLPPNSNLDNKFSLGIYINSKLIGIIDLIKDYPQEKSWWLGLLLFESKYRGRGIGHEVLKNIENMIQDEKGNTLALGVIESNNRALKFWKSQSFKINRITSPKKFINKEHKIIIMTKKIG